MRIGKEEGGGKICDYSLKRSRSFAPEEKQVIKALLEGIILKHGAKRWPSAA